MSSAERPFEQVRDDFFVNPKTNEIGDFGIAAEYVIQRLLGNTTHEIQGTGTPISLMAEEIAQEMHKARRFDHFSMAQLHPADNMVAMLAHMASTTRNNNTIIGDVSPVETGYERSSVAWMIDKIAGYNIAKASGSLVGGGTCANETALFVARERLTQQGWDGTSRAVVLANEMAHYSVDKAVNILAPNRLIQLQRIPFKDNSMVMDTDALAAAVRENRAKGIPIMAIVGLAGETETGLVEDLGTIADIAHSNGAYLHIDGAYGAPYRLSRKGNLLDEMREADSITCDPHKYLYIPYSAGAVLFKRSSTHSLIENLNADGAAYMFKPEDETKRAHNFKSDYETHLGKKRIEGSMGGQAASALYWTLQKIGETGLTQILDHTLDMTELFADKVKGGVGSLRPLFTPDLNTVCVIPDREHDCYPKEMEPFFETTVAQLEERHGIYISTTSIPLATKKGTRKNRKVFRIVPTHPFTDADDIEFVAKALNETWHANLEIANLK